MKTLARFTMLLLVVLTAAAVYGFTSELGTSGQLPNEYDVRIAGDTILAGQVVSFDWNYNSYLTGSDQYETGAWVIRSTAENDSYVAGVACWAALPGQTVKIVTYGPVAAKIDGMDSGPAAGIVAGDYLSATARDGFLGSSNGNMYGETGVPTANNEVGYLQTGTVATTDSGALTTYSVFLNRIR